MNELEYLYKKNKYMTEFILLYKNMPCLWRVKSKEYHVKELRAKAYDKLVCKLKEIDPTANRMSVVKKINSLRTSLRKEKKKVAEYLAKEGVTYQPRLWYYYLFDFLDDQERNRSGDDQSEEESEEPNVKVEEVEKEYAVEYVSEDDDPLVTFDTTHDESSREVVSPPPKRHKNAQADFSQVSSSRTPPEHRMNNLIYEGTAKHESREDQYDVFGKNVAAKLRDIAFRDNTQRLIAEKIVNDALFLAEMGQLTLAHCNKLQSK